MGNRMLELTTTGISDHAGQNGAEKLNGLPAPSGILLFRLQEVINYLQHMHLEKVDFHKYRLTELRFLPMH